MNANPRTYLVGRANSTIPCDIAIPTEERSVSRKHMELTVTADDRYYIVHVHTRNKTKAYQDGQWIAIGQDFVDLDTPLRLGGYETTVRHLLAMLGGGQPEPQRQPESSEYEWDPEAGTIVRPRNH